ncbi:hypothetical protein FRC02_002534 [Tulasnella sp. 418]|nr:hypothetical protein FRC02_002534 [Tulasnella sp. 418]
MRAHPIYISFQRRWQLPVYFQLRWREIVGRLEDILSGAMPSSTVEEGFATPQASAVYHAVQSCWSSEIYIPELGHRFWRLTLQILSRYNAFLEETLPKRQNVDNSLSTDPTYSESRVPTPSLSGNSSQDSSAADEVMLKQFASTILDIRTLQQRVNDLWQREIGMLMPETPSDGDQTQSSEDILRESLEPLTSRIPELSSSIMQALIRRCVETLGLVRSIPSQYRAMSKKRDPTEPSYFVATILQPVRHFLGPGGPGESLSAEFGHEWTTSVFDAVTTRYTSHLNNMKKTEDSLRRYKKGKKSAFSLFGGGSSRDEEEGKDEDRVRAQMGLDVEALGQDALAMGVDVENNEAFKTLKLTAMQSGE